MTHGSLGMTFEQASPRALVFRRSDGDLMTYGDGVTHHFTAAFQTIVTAARNRHRILRDHLAFRRDGIRGSHRGPSEFVLTGADPGMVERLAQNLVLNGRRFGLGTAIVRTAENPQELAERLGRIAGETGAEVVVMDDSYVRDGTSPGSGSARFLTEPRILLVYDEPGSSQSVGWARYVLEQRYGQRTTAVRAGSLGRIVLSDFDVIIFPSGSYGGVVNGSLRGRLQQWMREGGTLITLG